MTDPAETRAAAASMRSSTWNAEQHAQHAERRAHQRDTHNTDTQVEEMPREPPPADVDFARSDRYDAERQAVVLRRAPSPRLASPALPPAVDGSSSGPPAVPYVVLPEQEYNERRYHDFVRSRRVVRFGLTGIAALLLTVSATLAVLLGGEGIGGGLEPGTTALVGIGGLLFGIVIAFGCGRGNLATTLLAWLAGATGFGLGAATLASLPAGVALAGIGAGLVALVAFLGLVTLVAATLSLASWRGKRVERRLLAT